MRTSTGVDIDSGHQSTNIVYALASPPPCAGPGARQAAGYTGDEVPDEALARPR
jgi:hypothetical protein